MGGRCHSECEFTPIKVSGQKGKPVAQRGNQIVSDCLRWYNQIADTTYQRRKARNVVGKKRAQDAAAKKRIAERKATKAKESDIQLK